MVDLMLNAGSHQVLGLLLDDLTREIHVSEPHPVRPLDLGVLRTLTALEHLEAPAWAWHEIAELDAWPPSLVTLEFSHYGGDALTDVTAANLVLAHYGKPPIETLTWRG